MSDDFEDEVRRLRERVSELKRVIRRDLGVSIGPARLPQEPQTVECENCENEFDVDVENGLVCPHCGKSQSDEPEMATDGGTKEGSAGAPQELVVEFTQRFTLHPPEEIDDPVYAKDWFWNTYSEIGYDILDARKKDHYEVVAVTERDSDE